VLIIGETGTGKELIADLIHQLSSRKHQAMLKVNCAALPSALVESELFGREKGAYTGALTRQAGRFEAANGSTIFLDEVGELSPQVQAKLLRVLQEGWFERLGNPKPIKVDVRLIAATNRDLAEEMRKGRFREDLFYRLNVFPIKVPPLRERPEDVPVLAWAFLEEFCARMGRKITKVPAKTMDLLQRHSWPGNVRELRNIMEHGVIISHGDTLRIPGLQDSAQISNEITSLQETEREQILRALEITHWRIKGARGAAEQLDVKPSTLYSRMEKLGIPTRRQKDQAPP
jgi:transcriptional regulator with GAF, ATPase, and Fis domain